MDGAVHPMTTRRLHTILLALFVIPLCGCQQAADPPSPDLEGAEAAVQQELEKRRTQVLSEPEDGGKWGRYGMALDVHGYRAEAEIAYRRAIQLSPTQAKWPYFLGTILEVTEPHEAVLWYRRTVDLRPGYAPSRLTLAKALERLNQNEEAAQHYRRAVELEPKNPFGHLGLGQMALDKGDLVAAIRHMETAVTINPKVHATLSALAQARLRNGEGAEAERLAAAAQDLPRKTYRPDALKAELAEESVDRAGRMSRAVTYRDVGQLERALGLAQSAAAASPQHAGAALLVADINERLGNHAVALAEAKRAAAISPDLQGLRELQARVLFETDNFDDASKAARAALEQNALSADAHLVLGRVAQARGDEAAAVRHLRRALTSQPQELEWRLALAQALSGLGRLQEAENELVTIVETDSTNADAWTGLGHTRLALKRDREAIEAFDRALAAGGGDSALAGLVQAMFSNAGPLATKRRLELHLAQNPDDVVASLLFSDFLAAEGKHQEARAMLQRLSDQHPRRADLWLQLGHLELATGDRQAATAAFEQALAHSDGMELRGLAQHGMQLAGGQF